MYFKLDAGAPLCFLLVVSRHACNNEWFLLLNPDFKVDDATLKFRVSEHGWKLGYGYYRHHLVYIHSLFNTVDNYAGVQYGQKLNLSFSASLSARTSCSSTSISSLNCFTLNLFSARYPERGSQNLLILKAFSLITISLPFRSVERMTMSKSLSLS